MMVALNGPSASAQDGAEGRAKSAARLESMRRLAKEVKVRETEGGKPGPPLALRPEPLFRYSVPSTRVIDGTLWGWGERGRLSAVMKLVLRGPARGQRHWSFGVTVLSSKRVEVEFRDGLRWSSRAPRGVQPQSLADAPAPADSAAHRLTQAKALARRFSASELTPTPSGRIELRLLPRPIDQYSNPTVGLLDGVLFCFIYETNPVVLLVLEAWSDGSGTKAWRYALVRQGAGEATALLDGKPVWTVPSVRPPVDSELYMTRPMPADPADQD
jgi:hypothetical protein